VFRPSGDLVQIRKFISEGGGQFTENNAWKTGRVLFWEARKIDERMPLIGSDAAYKPEPLMGWATLQDVGIDGDRTMVKFENVKKIRGDSVALRFTFCN
jgi:hypothetical protein